MWARITLALVTAFPIASRAGTAIVLDPNDRPVADAAVMCSKHERDAILSDTDGRVTLPEWCRALTCMKGPYLPGRAVVQHEPVVCRLVAGARVLVRLKSPGCCNRFVASLHPMQDHGERVSGLLSPEPDSGALQVRLDPVRPGAYVASLYVGERRWVCRRSIELARTGEATIDAVWRAPHELAGVVVDEQGAPAGDIPVRARLADDGDDDPGGDWRCAGTGDGPDLFSEPDGAFRVPVDPARRVVIEAGSTWDPDGHVAIEIVPPFPESVTLRLRKESG